MQLAWEALPSEHRSLLTEVGASRWEVVSMGLGDAVEDRLRSAGEATPHRAQLEAANQALGMWVSNLGLVLINESHPALLGIDSLTREALLMWAAWHEWGHALSVSGVSPHDPGEGERLLSLAPAGIRERIRRGGYSRREYINELIAETYALLMRERVKGRMGRPPWLASEIYQLISRIGI